MIGPAERISSIEEYYFATKLREINARIKSGEEILNLGVGSPDMPPDNMVIDELISSANDANNHGYQPYKGIVELRSTIVKWTKAKQNIDLDADKHVLPLMGSKEGIMHISMSFINPGDVVLVPNPGYPTYATAAKISGGNVHLYNFDDTRPNLELFSEEILKKTKLIWVNYPHMPTGKIGSESVFQYLIKKAEKYNFLICHDNPYHSILNPEPHSALSADQGMEHTLELNSLSKAYNMAGWRIGWVSGSQEHIETIMKFKSNMDSGMFKPIQLAAAKALMLDDKWQLDLNAEYAQRKKVGLELLKSLGCSPDEEQAGMFIWVKIPRQWETSESFTEFILEKFKIFLTPGHIFGSNGEGYVRLSLCSPLSILDKALLRTKKK